MSGIKQLVLTLAVLLLATGLFTPPTTGAAPSAPTAAQPAPPPGVHIAETISVITGVAISPLLGVSAVGCYQWCRATEEQKAALPWFASPWFWVPAMLLLTACFVKDTYGVMLPTVVKKPLDALDALEHKISGLVATGAFVPIMVNLLHDANAANGLPEANLSSLGLAAASSPGWLYDVLVTPVAMAAFLIVLLASNAINILILLSPFATVDTALKCFRAALLASVAVTAYLNPWMGAAWALVILFVSYLIAGWSFRLSHFGLVFIWEFFTGSQRRFQPGQKENSLFLARKINRVPTRTYGRLSRNAAGELVFHYRPWLVLAPRTMILPAGRYETGRGLFYSEIIRVEDNTAKTVILLPPRYRGHEEAVTQIYQFAGTREVGVRAAWAWFKGLFARVKTVAA